MTSSRLKCFLAAGWIRRLAVGVWSVHAGTALLFVDCCFERATLSTSFPRMHSTFGCWTSDLSMRGLSRIQYCPTEARDIEKGDVSGQASGIEANQAS